MRSVWKNHPIRENRDDRQNQAPNLPERKQQVPSPNAQELPGSCTCQAGTEDPVQDLPSTAVRRVGLRIFLDITGGRDLRIPNSFPYGERLGWKVARHTHTQIFIDFFLVDVSLLVLTSLAMYKGLPQGSISKSIKMLKFIKKVRGNRKVRSYHTSKVLSQVQNYQSDIQVKSQGG